MYKAIRKSWFCSVRLKAISGPKNERVPTNKQRGRGSGHSLLLGGLDKSRHIVPNRLVSRSAMFKKRYVQGCRKAKHKTLRPIDDHLVIFSSSKAFDYFKPDKTKFASHLTLLSL